MENITYTEGRFKFYEAMKAPMSEKPKIQLSFSLATNKLTQKVSGFNAHWALTLYSEKGILASCTGDCLHILDNIESVTFEQIKHELRNSKTLFVFKVNKKLKEKGTFITVENLDASDSSAHKILHRIQSQV